MRATLRLLDGRVERVIGAIESKTAMASASLTPAAANQSAQLGMAVRPTGCRSTDQRHALQHARRGERPMFFDQRRAADGREPQGAISFSTSRPSSSVASSGKIADRGVDAVGGEIGVSI